MQDIYILLTANPYTHTIAKLSYTLIREKRGRGKVRPQPKVLSLVYVMYRKPSSSLFFK